MFHVVSAIYRVGCEVCSGHWESVNHLFVQCMEVTSLWYFVFRWVDMPIPLPFFILEVFQFIHGFSWGKKSQLGLVMIWHTIVWVIWKLRNKVIFFQERNSVNHWMNQIIGLACQWVHAHTHGVGFLLVEWECDPLAFLEVGQVAICPYMYSCRFCCFPLCIFLSPRVFLFPMSQSYLSSFLEFLVWLVFLRVCCGWGMSGFGLQSHMALAVVGLLIIVCSCFWWFLLRVAVVIFLFFCSFARLVLILFQLPFFSNILICLTIQKNCCIVKTTEKNTKTKIHKQ